MKRWLLLVCACLLSGSLWAEGPLKIISLHHRFAQDVLPSIQPLVGPDGVASAVGNNLLIRTSPERLADIERVIAMLDVERKTLRITVSHDRVTQGSTRELGASGSVRRGNVVVRVPDRYGRVSQGVDVDIAQQDVNASERASEFVSVLEGERANIGVGQSVPFTETWAVLTRQYLRVQQTVQFRDISTGFAVRPRAIGDGYELEIAPRIASLAGGVIVFEELATTVHARPGQWMDLGGIMQSRDQVSREILSGNSSSGRQDSQLWVRVQE